MVLLYLGVIVSSYYCFLVLLFFACLFCLSFLPMLCLVLLYLGIIVILVLLYLGLIVSSYYCFLVLLFLGIIVSWYYCILVLLCLVLFRSKIDLSVCIACYRCFNWKWRLATWGWKWTIGWIGAKTPLSKTTNDWRCGQCAFTFHGRCNRAGLCLKWCVRRWLVRQTMWTMWTMNFFCGCGCECHCTSDHNICDNICDNMNENIQNVDQFGKKNILTQFILACFSNVSPCCSGRYYYRKATKNQSILTQNHVSRTVQGVAGVVLKSTGWV